MQEFVCDVLLRSSTDDSNYHLILFADDTLSEMLWIHKRRHFGVWIWIDVQYDCTRQMLNLIPSQYQMQN